MCMDKPEYVSIALKIRVGKTGLWIELWLSLLEFGFKMTYEFLGQKY